MESDPNIIYGGDFDEDNNNANFASLGELILNNLQEGGENIAFINGATGKQCTFNEMRSESVTIAQTLYGAGFRQNDVAAIVSENRHEFPYIAFGTFFLNGIVAPINITYTPRELNHALSLSKPKFVFTSAFAAKNVVATCKKLKFVKKVVLIDGKGKGDGYTIPLAELIRLHAKVQFNVEDYTSPEVDIRNQAATIMCSSGTTGMPKGVVCTQSNLMATLRTYSELFALAKMLRGGPSISYNVAPFFHAMGFVVMYMIACSKEITYVFLPKFDEKLFFSSIAKYKISSITVVPPIMVLLAKSPLVEQYDLSSLTDIGCGAAALSKETEDQVRDRLERMGVTVTIRQGYGMSEGTLGFLYPVFNIKPGSVGQVMKGFHGKVIDEDGKSLGANQRGELCFKGEKIMRGYVNDAKATNETIDKEGWLHTGDIGFYDEDQQFFIVDRLKELIKYKGFQVPPAELEGLLLTHPKIADCGVIGIPDEEVGERAFAFVVKQPNVELTEKEVVDFVAENVSAAKRLHGGCRFTREIPKNPSGKILRRELRKKYKTTKSKL